ncbi:hypothetical protein [Bradyrhizobium sp.]|uniref:hypothetical protein n=1 Tax=Bradyrhizobium sp. TaxID=376 RepID=UPI003C796F05
MIYVATGVFLVWLAGLYVLAGRSRDDVRQALDNRVADAPPSDFRRFGFRRMAKNIDPAQLTEAGRQYLERAIRTERIMFHWMIDGFLLVVVSVFAKLP